MVSRRPQKGRRALPAPPPAPRQEQPQPSPAQPPALTPAQVTASTDTIVHNNNGGHGIVARQHATRSDLSRYADFSVKPARRHVHVQEGPCHENLEGGSRPSGSPGRPCSSAASCCTQRARPRQKPARVRGTQGRSERRKAAAVPGWCTLCSDGWPVGQAVECERLAECAAASVDRPWTRPCQGSFSSSPSRPPGKSRRRSRPEGHTFRGDYGHLMLMVTHCTTIRGDKGHIVRV